MTDRLHSTRFDLLSRRVSANTPETRRWGDRSIQRKARQDREERKEVDDSPARFRERRASSLIAPQRGAPDVRQPQRDGPEFFARRLIEIPAAKMISRDDGSPAYLLAIFAVLAIFALKSDLAAAPTEGIFYAFRLQRDMQTSGLHPALRGPCDKWR